MHDSVQTSLYNKLALEHVVPVRDWQLTCKDCCLSVISVIYDLLKIVLQLPFQSDHAKVVYDKQVVRRLTGKRCGRETINPCCCGHARASRGSSAGRKLHRPWGHGG